MVKDIWYKVFLSNTNNFKTDLFGPRDGTLTGTTAPDQSGPGNNGNKGGIYTP